MSLDATPRAFATVTGPTATFTTPEGLVEPLVASAAGDIRQIIVGRAVAEARRTGTPVELVTTGDRGEHHLLIAADGAIASPRAAASPPVIDEPSHEDPSEPGEEVDAEGSGREPLRKRRAPEPSPRPSFIETTPDEPPTRGWRALLARLGLQRLAGVDDREALGLLEEAPLAEDLILVRDGAHLAHLALADRLPRH